MKITTMKNSILAMSFLLLGTVATQAASATLTTQADVDIRSFPVSASTNGYSRTVLKIENTATDPSTKECGKGYIRFQLPSDFGYATSATFTMRRAVLGTAAWTYSVYGLDQGPITNSPWTTLTWPELDGGNGSNATTWANAPGNVTNSAFAFTNCTLLGTFATKTSANGGVAGDQWGVTNTAALLGFLNAATNSYVTFMVGRAGVSSSLDQWASKENPTYAGPALTLEYSISTNLPARVVAQPQPVTQTVYETINAVFTASSGGTEPITNQWRFNGVDLADGPHVSGARSNVLTLLNLTRDMAGTYSLVVSNAFGRATSSNATLVVSPASITFNTAQMSNVWNLLPGSRPYLGTFYTERGLAYNSFTTNLLVVSSVSNTISAVVAVLDALTGDEKYYLNCAGIYPGVGSSTLALNMIGVAADGAVYGAGQVINLTNGSSYHYCIYRWTDDGQYSVPSQVFFSNSNSPAGLDPALRWGDNLAVRGGGAATEVLIAPASGTNVVLLRTSSGTDFQNEIPPTVIAVSGITNSGFATRGLTFGPGTNTFWAKNYANNLYLIQFDAAAATGAVLYAYSSDKVSGTLVGISTDDNQQYLAGVSAYSPGQNVQLYSIADLAAGPAQRGQWFYTSQNDNLASGPWASTAFGGNYLFALDANNGIKAFLVDTNWAPVVPFSISDIAQSNGNAVLSWPSSMGHNYQVQSSGGLFPVSWSNLGSPVNGAAGASSFTNAISSGTNLYYRVRGL